MRVGKGVWGVRVNNHSISCKQELWGWGERTPGTGLVQRIWSECDACLSFRGMMLYGRFANWQLKPGVRQALHILMKVDNDTGLRLKCVPSPSLLRPMCVQATGTLACLASASTRVACTALAWPGAQAVLLALLRCVQQVRTAAAHWLRTQRSMYHTPCMGWAGSASRA